MRKSAEDTAILELQDASIFAIKRELDALRTMVEGHPVDETPTVHQYSALLLIHDDIPNFESIRSVAKPETYVLVWETGKTVLHNSRKLTDLVVRREVSLRSLDLVGSAFEVRDPTSFRLASDALIDFTASSEDALEICVVMLRALAAFLRDDRRTVDLLGCCIATNPSYQSLKAYLERRGDVVLRSSSDDTGNDVDNNWVLEEGNFNLIGTYFVTETNKILEEAGVTVSFSKNDNGLAKTFNALSRANDAAIYHFSEILAEWFEANFAGKSGLQLALQLSDLLSTIPGPIGTVTSIVSAGMNAVLFAEKIVSGKATTADWVDMMMYGVGAALSVVPAARLAITSASKAQKTLAAAAKISSVVDNTRQVTRVSVAKDVKSMLQVYGSKIGGFLAKIDDATQRAQLANAIHGRIWVGEAYIPSDGAVGAMKARQQLLNHMVKLIDEFRNPNDPGKEEMINRLMYNSRGTASVILIRNDEVLEGYDPQVESDVFSYRVPTNGTHAIRLNPASILTIVNRSSPDPANRFRIVINRNRASMLDTTLEVGEWAFRIAGIDDTCLYGVYENGSIVRLEAGEAVRLDYRAAQTDAGLRSILLGPSTSATLWRRDGLDAPRKELDRVPMVNLQIYDGNVFPVTQHAGITSAWSPTMPYLFRGGYFELKVQSPSSNLTEKITLRRRGGSLSVGGVDLFDSRGNPTNPVVVMDEYGRTEQKPVKVESGIPTVGVTDNLLDLDNFLSFCTVDSDISFVLPAPTLVGLVRIWNRQAWGQAFQPLNADLVVGTAAPIAMTQAQGVYDHQFVSGKVSYIKGASLRLTCETPVTVKVVVYFHDTWLDSNANGDIIKDFGSVTLPYRGPPPLSFAFPRTLDFGRVYSMRGFQISCETNNLANCSAEVLDANGQVVWRSGVFKPTAVMRKGATYRYTLPIRFG